MNEMSAWVCRCGENGLSATDEDAERDWLLHAHLGRCTTLSAEQIASAIHGPGALIDA